MLTDPIADMLTRIRNANRAMQETVEMPTSRMKEEVARLLRDEGYISGYRVMTADEWNQAHPEKRHHRGYGTLVVDLKYGPNRERVITDLQRVSKPGRRVYAGKDRLPRVQGGLGTAIVSTSKGLVSARAAEAEGIGGEVVCYVW